jgi:glycerate 2-kinase
MAPGEAADRLVEVFAQVAARIDGAALVRQRVTGAGPALCDPGGRLHLLALGKVAAPMVDGVLATLGADVVAGGLVIGPAGRLGLRAGACPPLALMAADHPTPTERSLAAGQAARRLVGALDAEDHLLVLLSGGGSALAAVPAGPLTLADKTAATRLVARSGATIHELNAVRKHLSALKGGQLGLLTRARTTVLALSDVVGNDPGTIASGPFSPDPTRFADALALLDRAGAGAPAARGWLAQGAAGAMPETPKPGDPRLAHVTYEILAGPERVVEEALRAVEDAGQATGLLERNTELSVPALAAAYADRAHAEATAGGAPRILVGNGEPTIVVSGDGRGGRATHLALLMARALAGRPGVAFLAAGTDDRDGNTEAAGAVVDGTTWPRALAAGLDPEGALARCDSERPLRALGCLVRGPGTSNLLDLHLLAIG